MGSADQYTKKHILVSLILLKHSFNALMLEAPTDSMYYRVITLLEKKFSSPVRIPKFSKFPRMASSSPYVVKSLFSLSLDSPLHSSRTSTRSCLSEFAIGLHGGVGVAA